MQTAEAINTGTGETSAGGQGHPIGILRYVDTREECRETWDTLILTRWDPFYSWGSRRRAVWGGDLSLMSQFWLNCYPLGSTAPAVAKVLTVLWLLCYPVGALYTEGFSLTLSGSNSR